jgi:hypothetical protein
VATAGRTVLVSGVTVAIVLASLMLSPRPSCAPAGTGGFPATGRDAVAGDAVAG